jgi:hypothetical protein
MKKMSISDLEKFCSRHGLTLTSQGNGIPEIRCNDRFSLVPEYSEKGRFWDFKPVGPINDLDHFIDPYTELNGEWL